MHRFSRWLYLIGLALAVVLPLRAWIAEPITIASASMEPILRVGTLLILDKWSSSGRRPRRGEIVSFRSPVGSEDLVKRVIAVPDDEVQIRAKKVFVNRGTPPFGKRPPANGRISCLDPHSRAS